MNTILVIAAHPDDEVLGCGGTVARFEAEGDKVYTLILGEGITARDASSDQHKREEGIRGLKKQAEAANKILGVKKVYTFDFPDNRFDTIPLLDIIKTIEKIKEDIKPDIVFTHHYGDLNIDHQITFKAVITAFRPAVDESVKELYSFEIPSSTEWNAPSSLTHFMPEYFVDISKTIKLKVRAMKEYKCEIREYPHMRSVESIEIKAKQWGIQVGLETAEAFEVIRLIK